MQTRAPFWAEGLTARELFRMAQRCAKEMEREKGPLLRLEAREGVKGAGLEAVRSSGNHDPMEPTDARMDYEARIQPSIEDCEDKVNYACSVLYGLDYLGRSGGLYVIAEHVMSDILCLHYCQNMKWPEVAYIVGYSKSQTIEKARQALALIDAMGFCACIRGERPDAIGLNRAD